MPNDWSYFESAQTWFWDKLAQYQANAAAATNVWEEDYWNTLAQRLVQGSTYRGLGEGLEGFATTGLAGTLGGIGIGLVTDPVVAGCLECGDVPSEATLAVWEANEVVQNAWPYGTLENILSPLSPDDDPLSSAEILYAAAQPTVINVADSMPDPITTVAVDFSTTVTLEGQIGDLSGGFSGDLGIDFGGDLGADFGGGGGYDQLMGKTWYDYEWS